MTVTVQFSPPPSANRLWRKSKHGVHKSPEYRRWISLAAWEVKIWMKSSPPLAGKVAVSVKVPHVHKGRDLDNCVKPIFDALQAGGAVENDKQIIRFTFAWSAKENAAVEIELHEVAG